MSGFLDGSRLVFYDDLQQNLTIKGYFRATSVTVSTITSANNLLVAGGGQTLGNSGKGVLAYTYDLITWSPIVLGNAFFSSCKVVAYNGSLWLAGGIGSSGKYSLAYSNDGITWALSGLIVNGTQYLSTVHTIVWNGTYWFVGGVPNAPNIFQVIYSSSGINNWLPAGGDLGSSCQTLAYYGNLLVAGGNIIRYIYTNNDILLSTWTSSPSVLFTAVRVIVTNGSIWVASGTFDVTNILAFSNDGIRWIHSPSNTGLLNTIAWNGSMWVAGSEKNFVNTTLLYYSADGIRWTPSQNGNILGQNSPIFAIHSVLWNGSLWIAAGAILNGGVASAGILGTSQDGTNWNISNASSFAPWNSIAALQILPNIQGITNTWQFNPSTNMQIGVGSGLYNQGFSAIAMGNLAGQSSQGSYSIAIGNMAGTRAQNPSSIILNATPTGLENSTLSGFFVNPIRYDTVTAAGSLNQLLYNATTREIVYNATTNITASDIRVKTNVASADTDRCFSTIESLSLKSFEWTDDFYSNTGRTDKHELGFVAQELKEFFPKSIYVASNAYAEDFHSVDLDQIYKTHIGATKQLMTIVRNQQSTIDSLLQIVNL